MSNTFTLALAIHNHQPVGNFHWVFERAYERAYEPLIAALERNPHVQCALHYSGPLRDWLVEHRPDFFSRIRRLVESDQVELMTAGYYEPILTVIPEDDRRGQIRKLNDTVKRDTGYEPTGLWLTERVWEPSLPSTAAACGLTYAVVDDTHFRYAGLSEDEMWTSYLTEDQGYPLRVFASSQLLRYGIPFGGVDELITDLRDVVERIDAPIGVMGDDGEKLGLWPNTWAHCWQNGWVDRFFERLVAESAWLRTVKLADYVRTVPARGPIYLPTASYEEMTEWALPTRAAIELHDLKRGLRARDEFDALAFVKGGFWRNFLVKYPEANQMHKRMLLVHRKIAQLPPDSGPAAAARDELWKAQCNCPYWHGLFGGVYLPHIRAATYDHLIAAEVTADTAIGHRSGWIEARREDFDLDGHDELVVTSEAQNVYIELAEGGTVSEWDWRAERVNLLNTMTRRPEAYHEELRRAAAANRIDVVGSETGVVETIHSERVRVREPGLDRLLHQDRFRRGGFVEHLLVAGTTMADFAAGSFTPLLNLPQTTVDGQSETTSGGLSIELRYPDIGERGKLPQLVLQKRLHIKSSEPLIWSEHLLHNAGREVVDCQFGVEFSWEIGDGNPADGTLLLNDVDYGSLLRSGIAEVSTFLVGNGRYHRAVSVRCSEPAQIWYFPIETVSNSEAGFERSFQGFSTTLVWSIQLAAGETRVFALEAVARPWKPDHAEG